MAFPFGLLASGSVLLAAAYFAGVRLIPVGAGGTAIAFGVVTGIDAATDLAYELLFCSAALVALGGCYWQLRRTAERPPQDFWETRWRGWKWP